MQVQTKNWVEMVFFPLGKGRLNMKNHFGAFWERDPCSTDFFTSNYAKKEKIMKISRLERQFQVRSQNKRKSIWNFAEISRNFLRKKKTKNNAENLRYCRFRTDVIQYKEHLIFVKIYRNFYKSEKSDVIISQNYDILAAGWGKKAFECAIRWTSCSRLPNLHFAMDCLGFARFSGMTLLMTS